MVANLEKAMEKARKEQHLAGPVSVERKKEAAIPNRLATPVYRQVQRIQLDLHTVAENHCVCALPDTPESHFYKVLRTQIQHIAVEKGWRSIMVTSTMPDEGKTLTCINLAFSFARAYDQTVLLIDADLKKQQVHKTLGVDSRYGLIDYLVNDQPIKDCLLWPESEKLVIISGGKTVDGSSELLGSKMMKTFVSETRDRYEDRLLFFDVPPILVGADAIAFAPLVDGVVVVVRAGKTSIKQARKAIDLLPSDKLIGVILNGQEIDLNTYQAYYGKDSAGR
jgi:protein-tyrosine kinase